LANVNDYDKNDDDSGGLSTGFTPAQSSAVGSATGQGPQQAPTQKQQSDGYVPWSSFVSANQDVSQREAGRLQGEVQGDVTKAQSDLSGAQSTFNQGVDSNYNQPAQKQTASPAGPKGAQKQQAPPSTEQNQPQAGSATGWDAFSGSTPSAPTMRAGAAAAAPSNPSPGGTSRASGVSGGMTGAATALSQPAQSRVTSQNPANAVIPTGTLAPSPAPARIRGAPVAATTTQPGVAGLQPAPTGAQSQQRQSIQGYGFQALKPGATATGPKDLESAAGSGWQGLLGDTLKAQQEANALGSETGVQGILQQQQTSPLENTKLDAALINGQGAPGFEKLAQQYGGNQLMQNVANAEQSSQDKWNQLLGDEKTRQGFDDAGKQAPIAPLSSGGATVTSLGSPTSIGADTSGWNDDYEKAWEEAQADGQKAAQQNNGQVVIGYGGSNMGLGNGGAINVTPAGSGKPPHGGTWAQDPATVSKWWGGADGPAIGDKSISAADWYALAEMPPEARATWWKHHKAGG
jgi:hypothetical protein